MKNNDLKKEYGLQFYVIFWKLLRPIFIFVIAILISLGIILQGAKYINKEYFEPRDTKDLTQINFKVESGSSLAKVAANLEKEGIIKNRHIFKYYADFQGLGQKIQAGEYVLSKSMGLYEIANTLSSGDGKPNTRRITIIPGQTIEDIANYLVELKVLQNTKEFLNLAKTASEFTNYYYIDDLFKNGLQKNRKYVLEGYLSPNTYEIFTVADEKAIITKLLSQTDIVFSEAYHNRAAELNVSMDEILTLASIIEKEAKKDDFSKVSAVFHNRLRQGIKLQSDVTIHYISNVRRMKLKKEDINLNSPYNTYQVKGLPPGPICNPSPDAIFAALFPDENFINENYLYFCSKDPNTGELHFSKTLKEHENAVKIYAPLWEAFDKSRGL
ncbi:MAG: endolytic transglycosylase MltG [Eubacteriales bacterium]|nr:endolytic transglycosylase MltG [Eubacteriales bacterium]